MYSKFIDPVYLTDNILQCVNTLNNKNKTICTGDTFKFEGSTKEFYGSGYITAYNYKCEKCGYVIQTGREYIPKITAQEFEWEFAKQQGFKILIRTPKNTLVPIYDLKYVLDNKRIGKVALNLKKYLKLEVEIIVPPCGKDLPFFHMNSICWLRNVYKELCINPMEL